MNWQAQFQQALSAPDPATALRSLVLALASQGHSKTAIYEALTAFVLSLREQGENETTEELVLDVMDALTGFCHPDARLLAEEPR